MMRDFGQNANYVMKIYKLCKVPRFESTPVLTALPMQMLTKIIY